MKHPFCHSAKRPFFHSSFSSDQTGAISEARFLNSEELSRIKSSSLYLSSCPGRRGINSTQLFGPMSSSKISPLYCRLALNEIRQSNSSDDLCLLFCLMVQSLIIIYIFQWTGTSTVGATTWTTRSGARASHPTTASYPHSMTTVGHAACSKKYIYLFFNIFQTLTKPFRFKMIYW